MGRRSNDKSRKLNEIQKFLKYDINSRKAWWENEVNINRMKDLYKTLLDYYKTVMHDLTAETSILDGIAQQLSKFGMFGMRRSSLGADFSRTIFDKQIGLLSQQSNLLDDLVDLLETVENVRDTLLMAKGSITGPIKYDLFFEDSQGALYNMQGSIKELHELGLVQLLESGDLGLYATKEKLESYIGMVEKTGVATLTGSTIFQKMVNAQGEQFTNTTLKEYVRNNIANPEILDKIAGQPGEMGWIAQWSRGIQSFTQTAEQKMFQATLDNQSFALGPDEGGMQQKYFGYGNNATITSVNNLLFSSYGYLSGLQSKFNDNRITATTIGKQFHNIIESSSWFQNNLELTVMSSASLMDGLNAALNAAFATFAI